MMNARERTPWHRRAETLCLSLGLLATPLTFAQEAAPTKALPLTPSAALAPAQQLFPGHSVLPFAPGSQFYDKLQKPPAQARAALAPLEAQPVESDAPLTIEEQPSPQGQQSITVTPEEIQRSLQTKQEEQAVQTPTPVQAQLQSLQSASVTTFTPLCPTLSTNTLYTLSGLVTGDAACYHFHVTTRSKSTVVLTGQTSGTDMALYLMKDDGANNVTVVGASTNAGTADEAILALTEPGDYYWYMEAGAATGSPFNFGVAVNTSIDAYELNDTLALATVLPDKLNTIFGKADSSADLDYYQFTAVRGQDVLINLSAVSPSTSSNWIVELLNGGSWVTLTNGNYITISSLAAMQPVNVRVRPNPAAVPSTTSQYQLLFGSKPYLGTFDSYGESTVTPIPYGAFSPYLSTQFIHNFSWYANVKDSKGAPVADVEVLAVVYFPANASGMLTSATPYSAYSNAGGTAGSIVNFGTCGGQFHTQFQETSHGYVNIWSTDLDIGQWLIQMPLNPSQNSTVPITMGQICRQTLADSHPS